MTFLMEATVNARTVDRSFSVWCCRFRTRSRWEFRLGSKSLGIPCDCPFQNTPTLLGLIRGEESFEGGVSLTDSGPH